MMLFLSPQGVGLAAHWIGAIEHEKEIKETEERDGEEKIVIQASKKVSRYKWRYKSSSFLNGKDIHSTNSLSTLSKSYYNTSLAFAKDLVVFKQAFLI